MNQNELKHMLSQVDEQYIAEIIDAEETTEAVTITKRSRRFSGWTAIAAAVCVCVVGGGCLVWTQRGIQDAPAASSPDASVSQNIDTSIEEHVEYDLIWEQVPEEQMCIDYTLEAGGESVSISKPKLPFITAGFTNTRSGFYFDENETAVNAYAWLSDDYSSIGLHLSDKGNLYPSSFFVDFSADAERDKPVIHIYDRTDEDGALAFDLFFIYNGVGLTLETKGFTASEAETIAASFLTNDYTVRKLWEENDPSRYFAMENPLVASADFTMESTGGTHELDESCAFFTASPFGPTHFSGRYYLREDGSTANIQLSYSNQDKTQNVDVTISGTGKMYAHGQLESAQGADHNGTMLYGCHTENSSAVMSFHASGWDCQITTGGLTDDEILLFCDEIIKILQTDFAETAAITSEEYFFRDISEITFHRLDYVWNGLREVHIEDPGLDIPLELTCPRIYSTGDGMAQFALFEYGDENGSANIYLNAHGDMGSDFPITGETDGRKFNGVTVYGFSDATNSGRKELYFITKEGLGCSMICHKLTEEQVLDIARTIMDAGISLQQLLEKNAVSVELPYTVEWGTAKSIPVTPNRNAGGKYDTFGTGTAAFPADEVTGYIYRDENDRPVNILVRAAIGEQHVLYTLSDAGEFYLQYCDADTSGDGNSDKPVIHIVQTKDSTGLTVHELYFRYPGTAVSMITYNCTAEEALAYAEILLRDKPTALSASETVSDREIHDRGDYLLVWDRGPITYVDLAEPYDSSDISYDNRTKIEPPEMPFDTQGFTDFTGNLYYDEQGTPFALTMEFRYDKRWIRVRLNDAEHPFMSPSGSLGCKKLSEEYEKPVILGLEVSSKQYQFCYSLDGTTVIVEADGYTAGEAEQMIASIFGEKLTAKGFSQTLKALPDAAE